MIWFWTVWNRGLFQRKMSRLIWHVWIVWGCSKIVRNLLSSMELMRKLSLIRLILLWSLSLKEWPRGLKMEINPSMTRKTKTFRTQIGNLWNLKQLWQWKVWRGPKAQLLNKMIRIKRTEKWILRMLLSLLEEHFRKLQGTWLCKKPSWHLLTYVISWLDQKFLQSKSKNF